MNLVIMFLENKIISLVIYLPVSAINFSKQLIFIKKIMKYR